MKQKRRLWLVGGILLLCILAIAEWTPGRIRFLVDGVDQGSLTKDIPTFPMWFGIAISSGDAFTGDLDPTTIFPVSMDVDWVHIYKYNS